MHKGLGSTISLLLITTSISTHAAHINHDRSGQVALLPYYTVNNNFITNFTVTNTKNSYKAVRVRLVDSKISADLLNINLYLSPYDVWNATLRKDPDTGLPNLLTEDESCTYPENSQFKAGADFENPYTVITEDDLTEGYIEIIEMGEIADGSGPASDGGYTAEIAANGVADGLIATGDRSIPSGLLHNNEGLPADCSVVIDAWNAGAASTTNVNGFEAGNMGEEGIASDEGDSSLPYDHSHNAGLVAPTGGINAYGIMIDVANGAAFVQEGVHIDGYTTQSQHYLPDDPVNYRLPSLASGDIRQTYITNANGDDMKGDTMPLTEYDTGALQDISPRPSVPMGSNPLPIAAILSTETVDAPYFIESNINGITDMVLTFPMKKHGIYIGGTLTNQLDSGITACSDTLNDGIDDGQTVNLTSLSATVHDYPHDAGGAYCQNVGYTPNHDSNDPSGSDPMMQVQYFDYENQERALNVGITIVAPLPYPFINDNVIAPKRSVNPINLQGFGNGLNKLFGTPAQNSALFQFDYGFEAGWLRFDMDDIYNYQSNASISALTEPTGGLGSDADNSWSGVPVIGFSAMYSEIGSNAVGEMVELSTKKRRD
jgi:hypothetical protein